MTVITRKSLFQMNLTVGTVQFQISLKACSD